MKRLRRKDKKGDSFQADAILTSDWHLRESTPACRTDDFERAQWKKVDFVMGLAEKHDCPVLHAGDLFHHWKPSPYLLSQSMAHLTRNFHTVYGQHDLPNHNFNLRNKSGIYALEVAKRVTVLQGTHYAHTPIMSMKIKNRTICVWHHFVWDGVNMPWPGCEGDTAGDILKQYSFDLIVTGDYHKPFIQTHQKRLLVNPGCLTRQATDYEDHQPYVFLYNAEKNAVKSVTVPCEKDVIDRGHIDGNSRRNKRLEAFIRRLNENYDSTVSFENNLEKFLTNNRVSKHVEELIYRAIDN